MMRVWLWVLLVFLACAGRGAAEPPPPPSCAILAGSAAKAPDPAVRAVLETRLFAEPALRFVEREEVARVVQEHNLGAAEWTASASRVQLGAIISADVLVFIQGLAGPSNTQTRLDVTESRTGVMLASWIEDNAAILAAPDAIVARIRAAAEKTRIPLEARHLVGLLEFRGEESGLAMEGAAATLSELTIPALSRIPNLLVLDREHIEHLQTERDLTAMEAKLRPSVMLLEAGLRGGGTTNTYLVTVQLRRLAGGGATNRVIEAPRADLVTARDRVVTSVAAMLGTVPAAVTSAVSRAEEAAAFSRQIRQWDLWGDHARAIRAAETAFAIEPTQTNRLQLALTLHEAGRAPLENQLRAKQIELDYDRVQLEAIAAGATDDLNLPALGLSGSRLDGRALRQQPDLVRELVRLDDIGFRIRLKHYADHFEDCETQYWATWRSRIAPDQIQATAPGDAGRQATLYWEAIEAFDNPPMHPERFSAGRISLICNGQEVTLPTQNDEVNLGLTKKMILHPHPLVRLLGHMFRLNRIRYLLTTEQALESRHATFAILTDEVPVTHPYRQHTQPHWPWHVFDEWLRCVLWRYEPLDGWDGNVSASAVTQDLDDKIRYLDSMLAAKEPVRFYALSGELIPWLNEIAGNGRPAEALRLTTAIRSLGRDHLARANEPFWTKTLPEREIIFQRMTVTKDVSVPGSDGVAVPRESKSEPQRDSVLDEYEYVERWQYIPFEENPVIAVDENRVCMVRPCDEDEHQPGRGVHAYVFWAVNGTLIAERHVAMPPWPVQPPRTRDRVHSAVLAGDTVYVGTSLGLLCIPLGNGDSRLLTQKDGLPGSIVRAVGWHDGLLYLGTGVHPESLMRESLQRGNRPRGEGASDLHTLQGILFARMYFGIGVHPESTIGNSSSGGIRPPDEGVSDEHAQGAVFASWDPASNRFEILAAEKAVVGSNPLDGQPFCLDVIVSDRQRNCVWLGDRCWLVRGDGDDVVWEFIPKNRSITRVDATIGATRSSLILPGVRHIGRPLPNVYVTQLESVFAQVAGPFDGSFPHHSVAFDGTNVWDVKVERKSMAWSSPVEFVSSKTYLLRRDRAAVPIAALPDGAVFPWLTSIHATGAGLFATMKNGSVMLIRRTDMKQAYLDSEAEAASGKSEETQLLRAAAGGRIGEIRQLLDAGVGIDATDGEGKTPLIYAIREGEHAAAELLLDRGANPKHLTLSRISVLSHAARVGDVAIAERLVSMGADVSQKTRSGGTPLLYAASAQEFPMVRFLVEHGADRDAVDVFQWNALHSAVQRHRLDMVEYLLDHGMNPDVRNKWGLSALLMAVERGQEDTTRLLLKRGANTETANSFGWTPLMAAVEKSRTNIVGLLLDAGAKTEAKDSRGWAPLAKASSRDSVDIVDMLLKVGANIETANRGDWTPIMIAIHNRQPAVARVLLQHKPNLHGWNNDGETPLHIAARTGQFDLAKLLLAAGADPTATLDGGNPPQAPDNDPELQALLVKARREWQGK